MEQLRERLQRQLGIRIALAPDLPMGDDWEWLPVPRCLRVRSPEVLARMANGALSLDGSEGPHGHAVPWGAEGAPPR